MKITEGRIPFLEYKTWYRRAEGDGNHIPLILLHGGPGSTHNYFELLDPVAADGFDLISYDQLGCGNSYVENRPDLWKMETWDQELSNLIDHLGLTEYSLLGQSFGGMLAIGYYIGHKPEGCRSLILSSTLSSSRLWGEQQHIMIKDLPQDEQDAIAKAERTGNYDDPAYLAANEHYMNLHCSGPLKESDPECLRRKKRSGTESYLTGWGPNEYTPSGTLKDFDYTDRLGEIDIPVLIISGTEDLCTPVVARTLKDHIPDSRWELFEGCRHMCFADDNKKYCRVLEEWLCSVEAV